MKKIVTVLSGVFVAAAFLTTTVVASLARAEVMECLVSVATANDLISGVTDPWTNSQIVSMPIVDGEADVQVQVGGETVEVSLWKFEHTDMYNFSIFLTTPAADIPAGGPNAVAAITDYLYNDGPTKENGWDLNPGPNATRFSYLNRQSGTFAFSTKMVEALKTAGLWGTHPYSSPQIDVRNMFPLVDFVKDQIAAKMMQPTDVVGLSTAFSCSLQK